MQHLGQGPVDAASGYTKVVDLVVVGGGGGHEPVHDSAHVTYRLLAPGTEPSRGPQPIKLNDERRDEPNARARRNDIMTQ